MCSITFGVFYHAMERRHVKNCVLECISPRKHITVRVEIGVVHNSFTDHRLSARNNFIFSKISRIKKNRRLRFFTRNKKHFFKNISMELVSPPVFTTVQTVGSVQGEF